MERPEIERHLRQLGEKLAGRQITGEIVLIGGAVMLLAIGNREATRDVDAYFATEPEAIRAAAGEVAMEEGLPPDWINDAAKGFFYSEPPTRLWTEYPGLRVFIAEPRYILAMKALAGRPEDVADIRALARHLDLQDSASVLDVVVRYIPEKFLTSRTRLLVESIFEV